MLRARVRMTATHYCYYSGQVVLERANVTAEFLARSQGPSDAGALDKFEKSHRDWYAEATLALTPTLTPTQTLTPKLP